MYRILRIARLARKHVYAYACWRRLLYDVVASPFSRYECDFHAITTCATTRNWFGWLNTGWPLKPGNFPSVREFRKRNWCNRPMKTPPLTGTAGSAGKEALLKIFMQMRRVVFFGIGDFSFWRCRADRTLCLPPSMIDSAVWNMRRSTLLSKEDARGDELSRRHVAECERGREREEKKG